MAGAASGRSPSSSSSPEIERTPRMTWCFPSMTSDGGLSIELKDSRERNDPHIKCMTYPLTIGRPVFLLLRLGVYNNRVLHYSMLTLSLSITYGFDAVDNFGSMSSDKASSLPTTTNTSFG